MGRITWVCATCAQHFTRGYSAGRHNSNLHEGKGIIVRLLDYIVGRISGQFLPNDPLAWRKKKGKEKGNPLFGSNHNNNNSFGSKVIADSTDDVISYKNMIPKPPSKTNSIYHHSKNTYRRSYTSNCISQPSSKVDDNDNDNDKLHFSHTDKLVERRIKLEEFKILVNKYYSHQAANEIVGLATFLSSRRNADFLDEKLMLLRDLDRAKFGYS
jgi:hypothetical protein